ncbi:hypothetical protein J2Z48_003120 [Croceifilum oryzae]|uniref:HTH cro/C1-type domain-containing protein n=1 Tax=Croceifilum oryzae TaxID=1553429 RepID=A0AAJ1WTK3_9BACL|nr:helix-turn-helix transcriptional regulator [Croceifilum oryzae]MDQ0418915.1 hypothetical protein [Croceifilum oryzae]
MDKVVLCLAIFPISGEIRTNTSEWVTGMSNPKNHEDLMDLLESVPGVKETVYSFSSIMGKAIYQRRLALKLAQGELAQHVQHVTEEPMDQSVISRIEGGSREITSETYDRVLRAIGLKDLELKFDSDAL